MRQNNTCKNSLLEKEATMTDVTNNRFYRTPAPTVDDSELVERVADAIMCRYLGIKSMPSYKTDEVRKSEQYGQCFRFAESALSTINIPAIKAQARREALEEAAKICAEYPYAMPMEEEIRNLIEREG
jgi:hypothetical protein